MEAALQTGINGKVDSSASTFTPSNYFGGASGGSIQLHTMILSGSGEIKANGAGTTGVKEGYGGVGAGGRIKLNFTLWYNIEFQELTSSYHTNEIGIQVQPGLMYDNMAIAFSLYPSYFN